MNNPYEYLGVGRNATEKEIMDAYRRIAGEITNANIPDSEKTQTAINGVELKDIIGTTDNDLLNTLLTNADGSAVAAAVYQTLLGHNTAEHACWNTPYALSANYQGIMMNLNVGDGSNMLFHTLQALFEKQNIDYFNSGSSDAVESVAIFPLSDQHLFAQADAANA